MTAREHATSDPTAAYGVAVTALDLWRGEPFADIDSPRLVQHRRYLEGVHFEDSPSCSRTLIIASVGPEARPGLERGWPTCYPTTERIATAQALSESS